MIWGYCKRGVVAGAIAGIAYGIFMAVVGNPLTEYMEALAHHGHDHGHGHDHAHAVSETTTAVVSVGSGVLWGIFLGSVFAVAYYFLEPTLPGEQRIKPYILAGAGFLTISATPWLLLPPAAPGAEQTLAMDPRMILYASLMIAGALLATSSVLIYKRLSTTRRDIAVVAGLAPIVVAVLAVPQLTPTIVSAGEVPVALFTAYQGLVVLSQASLWLVLAASYGWLSRRQSPEKTTAYENPTGATEA